MDGILVVDKPSGPTSHDVVDKIRRHFGFQKVGHGGTLDPQATGVLVILLGRGTKLSQVFMGSDKTYEGTIRLGIATDSHDAQGKITREADPSAITREQLETEMRKLTGDIMQTPPMVSAVKVNGVPLYKRARKGQVVERQAKLVHIFEFSLLRFEPPCGDFIMRCTKGTYVRTLCADVGEALGCGAHLAALRRTESGKIHIRSALTMEKILAMSRDELRQAIIPLYRFSPRGMVEDPAGG
jgi:tRNA pseudouridine55 synthase